VRRLRQGLPVLERDKMRAEIARKQLQLAQHRAAEYGLSITCREALEAAGDLARKLHGKCRGEDPGGTGCLCGCHDVRDTAVLSGVAPPDAAG
jgi:hypothetical protein